MNKLPWYLKEHHKPLIKQGRIVAVHYIKMNWFVYRWRGLIRFFKNKFK